jgi:enoyl-CoA hydratase/carnithine racemase
MGVLNRVVKRAELVAAARELATTMASKPAGAIAASKRGINAVFYGQRQF